tara:strand:- start:636 stop:1760 length:1125 start_codon:yes stop_codon:yes gene_type:complete
MSKLALTRYLYIYDEVGFSFITALLKKQSIDECYFWISELFLSGYEKDSWELIWFIYYDFYYINNPQFIPFILKKHNNGEGNLKDLMTVIKNLFKFPISSQVFVTRQYNMNIKEITSVFRGKKPAWLVNSIPTKYHALFRYIDKKLYHCAVVSLPDTIDSELFDTLRIYFNLGEEQLNDIKTKFNNSYNNDIHKLWSIICLLLFNPKYTDSKKKMFLGLSDDDYQNVLKIHNEPIPLNKHGEIQARKTLIHKCLYSINSLSSSFNLMRDQEDSISKCYWYHWEYYAYKSPIWKNRFDKYDITIDDENKKIVFNDDDEIEDFYEQYGYEPDEQSCETQNKLFGFLPNNYWKKWIQELFQDDSSIYEFKDDFKFNY